MAYNKTLAEALTFAPQYAANVGASTTPTTTQATMIWTTTYMEINARLESCGVDTPIEPDGSNAWFLLEGIEAKRTSAYVLQSVHQSPSHSTAAYAQWLLDSSEADLDRICKKPSILADLGATSSIAASTRASAYWTDYPQTGLDATDSRPEEMTFHVEDEL